MDSPVNVGDTTTNSILHRLQDTHLQEVASATISSATYSGQQVIQLALSLKDSFNNQNDNHTSSSIDTLPTISLKAPIKILRRVQDSYINITQLFDILIRLNLFSNSQVEKYLNNELLTNPQYSTKDIDDYRNHENPVLNGLWIPYDKAVTLAIKFDIYEFSKKLFLVDVHDFDKLPKQSITMGGKRRLYDESFDNQADAGLMGSPLKKQKVDHKANTETGSNLNSITTKSSSTSKDLLKHLSGSNPNIPYTLPPLNDPNILNPSMVSDLKLKYGEVFKRDDEKDSKLTFEDIETIFKQIISTGDLEHGTLVADIPLDQQGKTALHFASTLASVTLVSAFVKLGLCSPIRGTQTGESPLISTIMVTNAMEKGNFKELLSEWLWPSLWLYDNKKWSFLHYLASQLAKKSEASKFYLNRILEFGLASSEEGYSVKNFLSKLCSDIIDLQDEMNGNTCLHLAAESESKWIIRVLIELDADITIANKTGLKPIDFDIVNEVLQEVKNDSFKYENDQDNYILELLRSSVKLHKRKIELGIADDADVEEDIQDMSIDADSVTNTTTNNNNNNNNTTNNKKSVKLEDQKFGSAKIFQSIQNLLSNTNTEYETLINSKKLHLKNLNQKLHDTTIVTANNRFISKKISEKLLYLDSLKLQMANITDRLEISLKEIPSGVDIDTEDENVKYDADEPFRIQSIYDQLESGVDPEKVTVDEDVMAKLPPLPILQARLNAYQEINKKIETELGTLLDYSELTSKFKKVVSFCTGVDINEVDELLDGLLEAVEGQQ